MTTGPVSAPGAASAGTSTSIAASPDALRPLGLGDAVAFEWAKLRTVRSPLWTLVVTALVLPVIAVFVGLTDSIMDDDTILGGSLSGAVIAQALAAVFGVLVISGEYSTGMISTTFTAVPHRGRVIAAKAILVAGLLVAATLPAGIAAFAIGSALLSDGGYATGQAFPNLIGIAVSFGAVGLLGLALGAVLRHNAGAIVVSFALLMLPSLIAPFFGDLQRWIAGATPMATLQKLTETSDISVESVGSLSGWPTLIVLCAISVAATAAAALIVRRRDA